MKALACRSLDDKEIQVWLLDLSAGSSVARLTPILSCEEQHRAEKFKFDEHRAK